MSDLLTYLNVQILGLKPFHVNWIKTVLLVLCGGALIWTAASTRSVLLMRAWLSRLNSLERPTHHALAWGTGFLVAVVLSYVRACQFYQLQTMWDMAAESNVAWHMVHGPWFFNSLDNRSHLSQHFALVSVLIGFLYWLWESPVIILILQSIAVGLGAVAVYYLALLRSPQPFWAPVMTLLVVWNWYLHVTNAHDFHRSLLAIPVFLWMLYGIESGRKLLAGTLTGLVLTIEESMGPILAGVGLYLVVFRPGWRRWGAVTMGVSVGYFLLVTMVFMPALSPERDLYLWRDYIHLGSNLPGALANILMHPIQAIEQALFTHNQLIRILYLLLSCGLLPLLAWREALMAAIPLFIMLLSERSGQYSLGHHYTAPALPFLFYSMVCGVERVHAWLGETETIFDRRLKIIAVLALLCLGWNIYRIPNYDLGKTNPDYAAAAFEISDLIPPDASVAADVRLLPLVVNRHRVCKIGYAQKDICDWMPVAGGTELAQRFFTKEKLLNKPQWEPDYVLFGAESGADPLHEIRQREVFATTLTGNGGPYVLVEKREGIYLLRSRTLSAHRRDSVADIGTIRPAAPETSYGRDGAAL